MILLGILLAVAQSFDVASVKPTDPNDRSSSFNFTNGGGIEVKGATLRGLIEMAYDVRQYQILGGTGWVNTERYSIVAKLSEEDAHNIPTERELAQKQSRQRVQALLADRFQLKVHKETKEMAEYALVVGKGGMKAKPSEFPQGGISYNCGIMTGTHSSMRILALVWSRQLGRPVLDRTDLTGYYDFKLNFAPGPGTCGQQQEALTEGPSLFTALQEQIGVKLESIKGPVELIVVDHAEKADAN